MNKVQILNAMQIDAILQLQDLVVAQMPKPEFYVVAERQELSDVAEHDILLGIFEGDTLIAAAICIRNRVCSGNLGQKWREDPTTAFTFDAVFSHPEHRGKGLQRKLIEAAKEIAIEEGAKTMWCTVAPDNLFSYRNFTKAGFMPVEKNVIMYGGRLRDVLKMTL